MEIILLERVEKLGQMGDVVTVKPGYARNFLLPRGKALRANKANLEKFESERADLEARNAEQRSAAEGQATDMENLTVSLVRAASEMGQLFGSVSARDIAAAVAEKGYAIDKRQVVMDKAIKTLGLFDVKVTLHAEVAILVTVNVARSLEEAETQLQLGHAIVASDLEEAAAEEDAAAEAAAEEEAAAEDAADEAASEEAPAEEAASEEAADEEAASEEAEDSKDS